jgi:hypothetical protein
LAYRFETISLRFENRDQTPHGIDGSGYVGPDAQSPAVMQANDGSVPDFRQHTPEDSIRGQFPIKADYGPHDAQQVEAPLCLAEAGPPHAEWGAEQSGGNLRRALDSRLGASQLVGHESWAPKVKLGVRVGVISDFVTLARNFARDLRQALDVGATLKKGGGNAVIGKHAQQARCRFARSIIKGESDGAPGNRTSIDRRREQGGRAAAHSVGHQRTRPAGG